MNWKLIFKLSLFGLAMSFATISIIPTKLEFPFWIVIFIVCAIIIAKNCKQRYFLNGFCVSLINCIWITSVHVIFYFSYITHHPEMKQMNVHLPLQNHPRIMMIMVGPIFGIIFGLILGLFSTVASIFIKSK